MKRLQNRHWGQLLLQRGTKDAKKPLSPKCGRPKSDPVQCPSPIFGQKGSPRGSQKGSKIDEKQLFVVTFCRMRFLSMFSCIFDPSRPIFVDSWSCGEPFGYVKHRSKCTFAFSDFCTIVGEVLLHLEEIFGHFDLFFGTKITKIREKWGLRIEVEN